ncbi:mitochondrial ubiquitin ligase activator of nfkb 1-A-like [Bufo gargarizans]|uniref:mitochondrial ubiquitin ligase activator of nfkb 1-A-like n=1 Tax=Bufo gargarizans TaxID=30331 RepID=UPI001CF3E976|nr:mitochondrial ubiquitin ligase activator of nfkb 1-A-like [Bufo gargarizans]
MEFSALETVCVGSSLALAGLCYYMYRQQQAAVRRIQTAPKLQVGADLRTLLDSCQELSYVVLQGRVEAAGTPLCSQNHPHLLAVIQKNQMVEHRLFWNSLTNSWSEYVRVLYENVKSVPFHLRPLEDGDESVLVCDPLNATGLTLETVYERFESASLSLRELLGHYLSGEKPTGFLETEEILPVGAVLTGLGKLVLNKDGVITLQPPQSGCQYFLSQAGYEDILHEQESIASLWREGTLVCGVLGASIFGFALYQAYQRHKEKNRRQEFSEEVQTDSYLPEDETSSERLCVICVSRLRDCVILPCGHVCCCFLCYRALPNQLCPICRCHIERVVPLH